MGDNRDLSGRDTRTMWVIVGIGLTVRGGYGILEKVQLVIVGLLIVVASMVIMAVINRYQRNSAT